MTIKQTAQEAIVEARMRSHRNRFAEDRASVFALDDGYGVFGRYDRPADLTREHLVGTWSGGNVWSAGPRYTQEMADAVAIDPRRG